MLTLSGTCWDPIHLGLYIVPKDFEGMGRPYKLVTADVSIYMKLYLSEEMWLAACPKPPSPIEVLTRDNSVYV